MAWWGWAILIAANLPVYWLFGIAFFGSTEDFFARVRYALTLDWSGENQPDLDPEDWEYSLLFYWFVMCASAVGVEWLAMHRLGWI